MRVLCTFPGKHGDTLWALPTMRAIAEETGDPVDLVLSERYGRGLAPLLRQQSYLGYVRVFPSWEVQDTAPITPWQAPEVATLGYDQIVHLGYRQWPERPLPFEIYERTLAEYPELGLPIFTIEGGLPMHLLDRPWITVDDEGWAPATPYVVGFTDEYFELKFGIAQLLLRRLYAQGRPLIPEGSRWEREGHVPPSDWIGAARSIADAKVLLACCSALHVLAVAMGKPVVAMEPNPQRWQDLFWPLGKTGRVQLVLGGDGQPTFDARHVGDALEEALRQASAT